MFINGQVRNSINKQNHLLGAMKKESKKDKKCLKKKDNKRKTLGGLSQTTLAKTIFKNCSN
jgi:hypothetical protein